MEHITLTTPISELRISRLRLDWDNELVAVAIGDANGALQHFTYEGTVAASLMRALNTANLSTKSLQRRVLEQLVADGKLSGAITGLPE